MRAVIDTAVIMAGGKGMRLQPYTAVVPKPLMPLGERPILELLIRQLKAAGIDRVILSVNHLAYLIEAVIGDGRELGVSVSYQMEERPLGTCGALGLLADQLPERFLVVNGDLLSDYPITELLDRHCASSAAISVATRLQDSVMEYGMIRRDAAGEVCDYIERPVNEYEVSIGIYAMEKNEALHHLVPAEAADMPVLIQNLLRTGESVQAVPAKCTWINIGHPEDYLQAQELFESDPEVFLPFGDCDQSSSLKWPGSNRKKRLKK
jgi:NDP-mannose synthase